MTWWAATTARALCGPERRGKRVGRRSVAGGLGRDGEAVDVWRTVNAHRSLGYAQDGHLICRFEPGRPHERTGTDPYRLVWAMRESGLLPADGTPPEERRADVDQPELCALALADSVFRLDLPRAEGSKAGSCRPG
ncbi:DUF6461 domain-containing protein [Streptomyces sp. NPDC091290]|uniref:DUF6461 domain-containing protein n=1 Tax=Streptomyces sp. NPDC091290 TaxID=3365990 RepID=UPI003817F2ED